MRSRTSHSSGPHPPPDPEAETLIALLRRRAIEQPARKAYTFLQRGECEDVTLTFGDLDLRARAIAVLLATLQAADEPVLLLYPQGLDYLSGFLGCLYARAVAVPLPLPNFNRNHD